MRDWNQTSRHSAAHNGWKLNGSRYNACQPASDLSHTNTRNTSQGFGLCQLYHWIEQNYLWLFPLRAQTRRWFLCGMRVYGYSFMSVGAVLRGVRRSSAAITHAVNTCPTPTRRTVTALTFLSRIPAMKQWLSWPGLGRPPPSPPPPPPSPPLGQSMSCPNCSKSCSTLTRSWRCRRMTSFDSHYKWRPC